MDDIWGPWIEHDGSGCPLQVGQAYEAEFTDGDFEVGVRGIWLEIGDGPADPSDGSWFWHYSFVPIIRYRIRKPRGMVILEALLQDLPQEVDA